MKKNLKTLLSLSVAALAFGGAFATANLSSMMKAPAEENTASVTWHLGEKVFEGPADDISNKDVITETKLSYEGVTTNRVRTAKPASGDINLTSWNCAKSKECADTAYVQFSITTAKPFTPTSLTLNAGAIKTGNARMDIKAEIGGSSYSIANNIIPARVEEDAKLDSLIDYSLSYKLVDIPAVKGELKLKFFIAVR